MTDLIGIWLCIAVVVSTMFISIAVESFSKEKTEQYRIQYNCPK